VRSGEPFQNFTPRVIYPQRPTLETSNFVHESAMRSLSLVMSECFLRGRGQGHVSNFYIVDFKNFATASRRYTGDQGVAKGGPGSPQSNPTINY